MWRVLQFQIELDKTVGCFRPDELITGRVLLVLAETLYVRAIRVRIYGEERTGSSTLTFFDVESALVGSISGSSTLPPKIALYTGSLSYPFRIKFPAVNYPPSLEVSHTQSIKSTSLCSFLNKSLTTPSITKRLGEAPDYSPTNPIRYILTAYLDIVGRPEWRKSDDIVLQYQPIVIAPPHEACVFTTRVPDGTSQDKTLSKDLTKECLAQLTFKLPREAWCAGDSVTLDLTLKNLGTTTIHHLTVDLHSRVDAPPPHPQPNSYVYSLTKAPHDLFPRLPPGGSATFTLIFHLPTILPFPTFRTQTRTLSYQLCGIAAFAKRNFKGDPPLIWSLPIEIANVEHDEGLYWPVCVPFREYPDLKPLFLDAVEERNSMTEAREGGATDVLQPPPYRREEEIETVAEGERERGVAGLAEAGSGRSSSN